MLSGGPYSVAPYSALSGAVHDVAVVESGVAVAEMASSVEFDGQVLITTTAVDSAASSVAVSTTASENVAGAVRSSAAADVVGNVHVRAIPLDTATVASEINAFAAESTSAADSPEARLVWVLICTNKPVAQTGTPDTPC